MAIPLHAYTEFQLAQGWMNYVGYGLVGLLCGRVVDAANGKLRTVVKLSKLPAVVMQLAVAALLPAVLMRLGFTGFVDEWQNTTAGLFFASMYMGMQSNLLATMQA